MPIKEYDYDQFEEELSQFEQEEEQQEEIFEKSKTRKKEAKPLEFTVDEPIELLKYLFGKLPNQSKTTVKSYLSHRQVSINNVRTTQFDHLLQQGDAVRIDFDMQDAMFRHSMLRIVYEDDHLFVINKRNGLLSMASDREREKTAYYILSEYLKSKERSERIFIVHRLDRETSGLMIFAKSQAIQHQLQQNWSEIVLERKYVAVVTGCPEEKSGTYTSYLAENAAYHVYSTTNKEEGELAVTHYDVLQRGGGNALLELELETGKKNQIRVHLQDMGCSIIGDRKYGGVISPIGRIALHARKIRFIHPVTGIEMSFDTGIPPMFLTLLKSRKKR